MKTIYRAELDGRVVEATREGALCLNEGFEDESVGKGSSVMLTGLVMLISEKGGFAQSSMGLWIPVNTETETVKLSPDDGWKFAKAYTDTAQTAPYKTQAKTVSSILLVSFAAVLGIFMLKR